MRISQGDVDHWRQHGFVLVPGFLSADELEAARAVAYRYFPTAEEYYEAPHRYGNLPQQFEFPFRDDALNDIATGPAFVDAARRILGVDDVFLTQSILWAKYGGGPDFEQALHVDYRNNSLLVPSDEPGFRQMPSILYLEDVTSELGPTSVVSRTLTRDRPPMPALLTPEDAPDLYAAETSVVVEAGTLLLYDMQTFHRGTRMLASRGIRLSFHNVFRAAGREWMGWRSWPREGRGDEMKHFIEHATVEQLSVIGIPRPGDPYWTPATLEGVQMRYPGLDMTPYREALTSTSVAACTRGV